MSSKFLQQVTEGATKLTAECETFLATPWETLVAQHASSVTEAFAREFDGHVRIFAPLYLSNVCLNNCAYCGFRISANFKRTTLDVEEAVSEADTLADQGYRTLDLVTGEVPTDRFIDYVAKITEEILNRTDIRHLNLNLGSLSTEQYRRLRAAGATGYHLYQETYDPLAYLRVHQSGQKRDMAGRLTGLHRAIDAGFEAVGLGVLLGLSCLKVELAHLIQHAMLLLQDFPRLRMGFSLPRIRPNDQECSFVSDVAISDTDFMKAMLFLRTKLPQANLTLTTRENKQIRDALLPLGISKMSAGVSTSPGGYSDAHQQATEQFEITDKRSLKEIAQAIERADRIVIYE
jgi:2-iminoacetate synthase